MYGLSGGYFFIQLGKKDIWLATISSATLCDKLKDQLPNTAAAISLAATIAELVPPLFGVNLLGSQLIKLIPEAPVIKSSDFYIDIPYMFSVYQLSKYKAAMLNYEYLSGGILPISKKCNPLLYGQFQLGLPDIVGIADSLLSVGTLFDPLGTLLKLITEQLPTAVNSIQCNILGGIAPPIEAIKPLAFGADNFISGALGLWPGAKWKSTLNLLESQNNKHFLYTNLEVDLPVPPEQINVIALANLYALTCGIDIEAQFPILNVMEKIDIIKETFALTVGRTY